MLAKVLCYIVSIIYIQCVVIDIFQNKKSDPTNNENHLVCWMLYEVAIFYFNAFSQIVFLLFSRFKSFVTLRERVRLSPRTRYKKDFLDFC